MPILLAVALAALCASAQTITASLEGIVKDPTGAVIAAARVQIVNADTQVATSWNSDGVGRFLAPSLPPGSYSVIIEAAGFKKMERSGILLQVNQAARMEITMELGAATETVSVRGEAPLLESSSAAMGQVIDNRSIVNLPLNERNSWSLVFLAPGVNGSVGDKYNNVNISINGGRPGSANLMVDGIPSATALSNPISGFTIFPSVDAVQEFKVETNTYSAEFGRSGSGVINMIYKSGTNQLRGTLFEFLRNSKLDANDFFANTAGIGLPAFKRNQFGTTVSGPVVLPKLYNGRNRSFFLFSFEGLRQSSAGNLSATVPTAQQRAGDFSRTRNAAGNQINIYDPATTTQSGTGFTRQLFSGNVIPSSRFDPVARNVVSYYAVPNAAGAPNTGANNYLAAAANVNNIDNIDAKFDENINERHRFFVRFSRRTDDAVPPNYFPQEIAIAQGGVTIRDTFTNGAFDYTLNWNPTFLIGLRYGYGRSTENRIPRSQGFDPVQLGLPAYMRNANAIMFPGFQPSGYFSLGNGFASQWGPAGYNTHSLGVNNMKVFSKHLFKFGTDIRVMQANVQQGANVDGGFSFDRTFTQGPNPNAATAIAGDAMASFLLGVGTGSLTLNNRMNATTGKYVGFYAADDWKITSRLTLNIGLRYGFDFAFTERFDRMNVFDPTAASPLAAAAGLDGLKGGLSFLGSGGRGRRLTQTDLFAWDPRFGFAYQLRKRTVIRGGYGIFHAPSLRSAQSLNSNTGFSSTTQFIAAANGVSPTNFLRDPFPGGLLPVTGNAAGLLTGVGTAITAAMDGDYRIPYTQNWSANVQQQLPANILLEAGYTGNRGLHLSFGNYNLNQLRPEQLSSQLQQQVRNPFFGQIATGTLSTPTVPLSALSSPFPQFLNVGLQFPSGSNALYHSFQLKAEKRFSKGVSFLLSYTAQKLMDNNSIIAVVGSNAASQNIYDRRADWSVSANDVSQLLALSYVYELPFGRGRLFGGWQVNGVFAAQTGLPLALSTQNTSGAGNAVLRPNNNGRSAKLDTPIESRLNKYFDTTVFSQPAPFTLGNAGRVLPDVRTHGARNMNLSLFKNVVLRERVTVQFRAEAFNLTNSPQFGRPNSNFNAAQFGVISAQANDPRQLQFGLKLLF
ncbi:MAG: TonB-dependent receptor [Candidatus Solibacter usitatus]|nr:TonB-dependent receptor [Candidatus Solibacter usitatus]